MKLLALETATEACSVALWIDGDVRERFEIAPRRHAELVLPWADALLAEAGIAKMQLDAIAVGRGPGAFTGVRLAIALAQGIALALDRPIVPISTLAVLAMRPPPDLPLLAQGEEVQQSGSAASLPPLREQGRVGEGLAASQLQTNVCHLLTAIDARMGEIYLGAFARDDDALVTSLEPEHLLRPADACVVANTRWIGVGTGFAASDHALVQALGASLIHVDALALPHAADLARLAARAYARGEAVAPEHVEPAYLRDKVALTLGEQQAARGTGF
ncbi:MAG: tRNA (adenosine(37)-N6)-threonylcarbamoyltransferase complex dimerization subunit type 1 TsaB [Proteobacteria bacterium]|nr:tRNA (adenosine(37)-N6)-threonylcarbamoyltransferase complex dimerization subunit type 1 TsaB [Pseudomonadota bacterium]